MLKKRLNQIFNRTKVNEDGNDVVTLLFVLPIIVTLLFTMIDVSYYLQTRSMIQSAAQDGARMVALYGGQAADIPLNKYGKSVENLILPKVYDAENNKCVPSSCLEVPVVTCTPDVVTESMGLGTEVSCNIRYVFAPASLGLAKLIGFDSLLASEINVTQTSVSETYYIG